MIHAENQPRTIRVMLVDDHPVVRAGYRRLLGTFGDIEVVGEAGDGKECLSQYGQCVPDVLVLDLTMPDWDGFETIRRLLAQNPDAKVLVFTMHESKTIQQRALVAGARGYMLKNSMPTDVVRAIRLVSEGKIYVDPNLSAREGMPVLADSV